LGERREKGRGGFLPSKGDVEKPSHSASRDAKSQTLHAGVTLVCKKQKTGVPNWTGKATFFSKKINKKERVEKCLAD